MTEAIRWYREWDLVLADGRRVVYPPGGGIRIEEAACGK